MIQNPQIPPATTSATAPGTDPAQADAPPPRAPRPNFAQVRADIERARAVDALLYEEGILLELQTRLRDERSLTPEMVARTYSASGFVTWEQVVTRLAVATGRQVTRVAEFRARVESAPDFELDEIARPLGAGTTVRWTGD